MSQNEYFWKHQRRFNSYAEHFRLEFGQRVQKVTIDAGFTCPNRDGSKSTGGCTYCNNDAFNPSYCHPAKSVSQQIKEGIEFHKVRYRRARNFLAYFQAYSNTYASLGQLKSIYEEALAFPDVIGLVIGTRPDCIDDEKLEYFSTLARNKYIIIEYGLESCYNTTLTRINRQHSFEDSVSALEKTAAAGIRTGAHIIFGLPGETRSQMLEEAKILSALPINNIKFHQLQIINHTRMADEYKNNPEQFELFSLEEYIDFITEFIENLNPSFVIERFTSEVPPRYHAGPNWGNIRTDQLLIKIEERLKQKDSWQGKFYKTQS